MKWREALKGINQRLTELALHGKGKAEIHITPREDSFISVSLIAGENITYLVEKASIVEED